MKRLSLTVAACGLALFVGVLARKELARASTPSSRVSLRQVELRYGQCQPRHWRSLLLQP